MCFRVELLLKTIRLKAGLLYLFRPKQFDVAVDILIYEVYP